MAAFLFNTAVIYTPFSFFVIKRAELTDKFADIIGLIWLKRIAHMPQTSFFELQNKKEQKQLLNIQELAIVIIAIPLMS